jgi:hypothetical protein
LLAEDAAQEPFRRPLPAEVADALDAVERCWRHKFSVFLGAIIGIAVYGMMRRDWPLARGMTVVGLGLDIAAVWMLSHGALAHRELPRLGVRSPASYQRVATLRDKIEGCAGVVMAALGFALQLLLT